MHEISLAKATHSYIKHSQTLKHVKNNVSETCECLYVQYTKDI